MKKFFKWLLLAFILLLSIVYLIIGTEIGSRWLLTQLMGPQFTLQKISGKLLGRLQLTNIHYQDAEQSLHIDQLAIDWQPLVLLTGKLQIQSLTSHHVTINLNPVVTTQQSTETSIPWLPTTWVIKHAKIQHLNVVINNQVDKIKTDNVQLQAEFSTQKLNLNASWQALIWHHQQQLMLHNTKSTLKITGTPLAYQLQSFLKLQANPNHPVTNPANDIDIDIALTIKPHSMHIDKATLISTHTRATIQGQIAQEYQLAWQMQSHDMQALFPFIKGKIYTAGQLSGSKQTPKLKAQLDIKEGAYAAYRAKSIKGILTSEFTPQGQLAINLTAEQLQMDKTAIKQLTFATTGTVNQHIITTQVHTKQQHFKGQATGSLQLNKRQWQGTFNALTLTSATLGQWRLAQPALAMLSPIAASVQNFYLRQGQQFITFNGQWLAKGDSYCKLHIKSLDVNRLASLLSAKMRLATSLDAELQLAKKYQQSLTGQAIIKVAKGYIAYPMHKQLRHFNFNESALQAKLDKTHLSFDVDIKAYNQQQIYAEVHLPNFPQPAEKQPIQGELKVKLYDLALFSAFMPQIQQPQGKILADVKVAGTIANILTQGHINLQQGRTHIPALGIDLRNINLSIVNIENGDIAINGQAFSGEGKLTLNGQAKFNKDKINGLFNITGYQFLLSNLPDYKIYISPHLTVKMQPNKVLLGGDIHIPKGKIKPQPYSQASIEVTHDLQFVNEDGAVDDQTPVNLYSDINLTLGDLVSIDYSGLSGQLTGHLRIKDAPTLTATGLGELTLLGSYKAYGQNLAIKHGRLIFTGGDVANPMLDVEAVKPVNLGSATMDTGGSNLGNASSLVAQGNQIIIGVMVQGTVNNRQISLFSRPSVLNQTDILSYLVLGRPAAQATQADAQLLYNAASALDLGGNQIGNLSEQIKSSLGLDEIDIGTMTSAAPQANNTATNNTSLILGKALTPKLYLNYSIGLLQPINTLRLRYFFTPHWILQSETNSLANAVDIFYMFDR